MSAGTLHARSRGAGTGGAALLAGAVLAPLLDRTLPHAGYTAALQLLAVTAGVAVIGPGLTGADPDLEASTPRTRPRLRLVHLGVALLAVTAAVTVGWALLGRPADTDLLVPFGAAAALGGLLALAAPVLGARLSWLPPTTWVLVLLAVGPREHGWRLAASTPLLPHPVTTTTCTAVALLAAGAAAYVHRGARR